ncbi:MAG: hypothetical protein EOQ45_25495 [Mesorhizobium sp.]|uniref:hypothetical protein n=1 Tax=Mesorhizobium sp. TaxID=1871066 RepID=UPI000FEA1997|nr:hypothetical protein [Mesorhizobium sp.]RWF91518.1 MAG: hypothetical protein EOQ45_25495 [Mesorhizobium sp.]
MDAAFFLRRRTRFIRWYYATGVGPFREIQRKIDAQESPYDEPPSSFDPEDGQPAFLEEWIEADEAAQVAGRSAISLLSDSLKLYFKALEQQLEFRLSAEDKATAKKEGFLAAYRGALGGVVETDWTNCPVRFDVIEQIVLARNRAQHGEHLSILSARHDPKTLTKHRNLIFASEGELTMWVDEGADPDTWLAPRLEVTEENLGAAITEVEKLADWIEERIPDVRARTLR